MFIRRTIRRRRFLTAVCALAASAVMASVVAAPANAAADEPADEETAASSALRPLDISGFETTARVGEETQAGKYVVVLRSAPVASYSGGILDLRATDDAGANPSDARVQDYSAYLRDSQNEVAESVSAKVDTSYVTVVNGFSALLDTGQVAQLSADPRVDSVVPNEILHITDAGTSTDFLGLEGEDGVWDSLGGVSNLGEGIVVGVIDTGVAPREPVVRRLPPRRHTVSR